MLINQNVIKFISQKWNRNGVFFGEIIHNLKPKTKAEWVKFLSSKRFYLIKDLSKNGFTRKDKNIWIKYIIDSFWKLYESETIAHTFFSKQGYEIKRTNMPIDKVYGIDFLAFKNDERLAIIVKSKLNGDINNYLKYKPLINYSGIPEYKVIIFYAENKRAFVYDRETDSFLPY